MIRTQVYNHLLDLRSLLYLLDSELFRTVYEGSNAEHRNHADVLVTQCRSLDKAERDTGLRILKQWLKTQNPEEMNVRELRIKASQNGIFHYSRMSKEELIQALGFTAFVPMEPEPTPVNTEWQETPDLTEQKMAEKEQARQQKIRAEEAEFERQVAVLKDRGLEKRIEEELTFDPDVEPATVLVIRMIKLLDKVKTSGIDLGFEPPKSLFSRPKMENGTFQQIEFAYDWTTGFLEEIENLRGLFNNIPEHVWKYYEAMGIKDQPEQLAVKSQQILLKKMWGSRPEIIKKSVTANVQWGTKKPREYDRDGILIHKKRRKIKPTDTILPAPKSSEAKQEEAKNG